MEDFYKKGMHRMATFDTCLLTYEAAECNKQPLANALKTLLPAKTSIQVLEVASGTGQHATYFAKELPHLTWQPSECDQKSIESIQSYINITNSPNVRKPLFIDAGTSVKTWEAVNVGCENWDVLFCSNMIHIAPWDSTVGLFRAARCCLKSGGVLVTYGPYVVNGHLTDNNTKFDYKLRMENLEWGIRNIDDLEKLAEQSGMFLTENIPINVDNDMLVFRKS